MPQSETAENFDLTARGSRVTLSQVAQESGVSIGAVSQVLNGSRTATRVSPATRERIMQVASSLHYTPNAVARSLRRSRTDIIAFYNAQDVRFFPTYPFYSALLQGIHEGCALHGKDLLTHANIKNRSDDDIFLELHNGQIDGLLLYARTVTPLVQRLIDSHLPVVAIVEKVGDLPYVCIDEQQGAQLLVRHLVERGYKRALYRTLQGKEESTSSRERKEAFCREAAQAGLKVYPTSYSYGQANHAPTAEELAILNAPDGTRPDVVVCWGDIAADGFSLWCRQQGLRVPEDIALVGFDGFTPMIRPAMNLTTIVAPWSQVACETVSLLVERCQGKKVPQSTILPVELRVGDTT